MQSQLSPQFDISVLICTHNRADLLSLTISSLDSVTPVLGVDMQVVIVANACTDDTILRVQEWAVYSPWPVRVVVEPRPGLSIARNRALAESTGKVCAYLDDDVRVDPGWLEGLVRASADECVGFGGGKVKLWWEEVQRPAWFTRRLDSILSENDHGDKIMPITGTSGLVGANFWVKRTVFDQVGKFREDLGRTGQSLVGGEESDFVTRALAAGVSGVYCPDMALDHWVPVSRVTRSYLTKVSEGNEYGRIRMRSPMGPVEWLRCFLGHAKLWGVHHVLDCVRSRTQSPEEATHDASRAALGYGGLKALWDRWFDQG